MSRRGGLEPLSQAGIRQLVEDARPTGHYCVGSPQFLAELGHGLAGMVGRAPVTSAFLRHGDRVFHTYSSYGRGGDLLLGTYNCLDLTARGRQEDWEEPPGRSDSPFMGWLRHHDRYATLYHENRESQG